MSNKALSQASPRLISVDFWRGLCLLMIFIDHVPDSPLGMITMRSWGFSDAAEVFVFLAGFSSVLSFRRSFRDGGFLCGVMRVIKRTWQLFCAHVFLVFSGAAVFALADTYTDSKPVMEQMNFSPFFVETGTAILRLISLRYMPNLTDILPIYILFVGLFPLLWLLLRASPVLALALSGGVWLWANLIHFSIKNYPDGVTWFFNPLAWQFMFVLGATVCWERERIARYVRDRFVVALSAGVVIGAFIAVAPWAQIPGLESWRLVPAEFLTDSDKQNLAFLRIVHFVAVAVIACRLFPPQASLWKNGAVGLVSLCGRHALPIYCTGVIVAMAMDIYLGTQDTTFTGVTIAECVGVALLVALAFCIDKSQSILRRADVKKDQDFQE